MRRLLLVALLALVTAPAVHAGGEQAAVVAAAGRVWVTDGSRVLELDARSGRILRRVPVRYPFAIALALSDGNVWAESVEDGFVSGAVTRIPFDARRGTSALVPHRPVYEIASDGRFVWLLVGPHARQRLVRIDVATGRARTQRVAKRAGLLAADPTGRVRGLFATVGAQLFRYGEAGSAQRLAWVGRAGRPAVGLGSVWLPHGDTVLRVDPASGRIEGRLRVAGAAWLSVTVGERSVFVLEWQARSLSLLRIDPVRLRVAARVSLAGIDGAELAYGDGALWLSTSTPTLTLWQIDPATLDRRQFASLPF
ncbi:MAG: hypothetical protein ACRDLK_04130 [Gaiellaceae bacterium]